MFNELGRVVVLVEDQDEALRFYRDVLGFEVLHDETLDGLRYLHAGPPAQANVGVWLLPPASDSERERIGRQAGDQPLLVLYTDDLDAARAGLAEHGVEVWAERTDPGSRSLHFRDLVGNVIVGVQLTG